MTDTNQKPDDVEKAKETIAAAALEVAQALAHVDSIVQSKFSEVSYETMQRAGFNRKTGWQRPFNLSDARSLARQAALRLRAAWELLDPITPPPFKKPGE